MYVCNKSETIKNLAIALSKFQSEVSNPSNTAKNPQFNSKYAPLDVVIKTVKPILAKFGLSFIQSTSSHDTNITVQTMLIHESGEWIESEPLSLPAVQLKKGGEKEYNAQGAGSAITYARRYSLSAMLGISSEDDDDGNQASQSGNNTQPSQQTTQPKNSTPPANKDAGPMLTESQCNYAQKLKKEKKISDDDFRRMVGELADGNSDLYQMSTKQAAALINKLSKYAVGA